MSNQASDLTDIVTASLWNARQVHPFWAKAIDSIGSVLRELEPSVRISHHGPGEESGCTWQIYVDAAGKGVGARTGPWPRSAAGAWEVALSYRGPLITALSWSHPDRAEDVVTDARLVRFVTGIAADLGLTYADAHDLRRCVIPWETPDDLPPEVMNRLDWSSEANAFNLLFYEY